MSKKENEQKPAPLPPFSEHMALDFSYYGDEIKFGPNARFSPMDHGDIYPIRNTRQSLDCSKRCFSPTRPKTAQSLRNTCVSRNRKLKSTEPPSSRSPSSSKSSRQHNPFEPPEYPKLKEIYNVFYFLFINFLFRKLNK